MQEARREVEDGQEGRRQKAESTDREKRFSFDSDCNGKPTEGLDRSTLLCI